MKSAKRISLQLSIVVGAFLLAASLQALAFSEPGSPPPAGDVSPPLNTGSVAQSKAGGLILNTDNNTNGLSVFGNLGIGTLSPLGTLDVENGNNTATICLNGICSKTALADFSCPSGQAVTGFNGNGAPTCSVVGVSPGPVGCISSLPPSGGTQVYTSNDTFCVPSGVTSVSVQLYAGGAGSGGWGAVGCSYQYYTGAGSGEGGTGAELTASNVAVTPGTSIPIDVGSAGNAGTVSGYGGTSGGNGTPSTFGTLLAAGGGTGGTASGGICMSEVNGQGGVGGTCSGSSYSTSADTCVSAKGNTPGWWNTNPSGGGKLSPGSANPGQPGKVVITW